MALGKTIISTSQGAEGIHCRHMENIIIADTDKEFAAAISMCFNDKELCDKIGRNARILAEQYYDMRNVGRKVFDFYKSLVGMTETN
jgi:polysaccharide biosynthesis protein PslH